jgi:hypothetical protein
VGARRAAGDHAAGRPGTTPSGAGWQREGDLPGGGAVRWTRQPRLADAYLVGAVESAPLDAIAARLGDDTFDGTGVVLLDDAGAATSGFPGRSAAGPAGEVRGDLGDHGSGSFTVVADRPAVLVVSTAWLPGWSATVNGAPAPVARANGLVLAVPVPAGRSTVHLSFSPPGLRAGALSAMLSIGLLLVSGWFAARLRARRARRARRAVATVPAPGTADADGEADVTPVDGMRIDTALAGGAPAETAPDGSSA